MSYQTLDADYCRPFLGSYEQSPIDDAIHDDSDIMSGSHRAVTTRIRKSISYTLRVTTSTDKEAIETFYSDVYGTVMPWYWTNIFTTDVLLVRFAEPPSFRPLFGKEVWDITFSLEEV